MPIDIDQLEADVKSTLSRAGIECRREDAPNLRWTSMLTGALSTLAAHYDCRPCAKKCRDHGEWLFDLTWQRLQDEAGETYLCETPLVFECEWDRLGREKREIDYDFNKLLVARASLKVIVFEPMPNSDEKNQTIGRLQKRIEKFSARDAGTRYLFAAWNGPDIRFDFVTHEI
jgi:hypothetical protein